MCRQMTTGTGRIFVSSICCGDGIHALGLVLRAFTHWTNLTPPPPVYSFLTSLPKLILLFCLFQVQRTEAAYFDCRANTLLLKYINPTSCFWQLWDIVSPCYSGYMWMCHSLASTSQGTGITGCTRRTVPSHTLLSVNHVLSLTFCFLFSFSL